MPSRRTRTKAERRQAVLDAAAEILSSANVSWHAALTYDALEIAAGVDRSQISNDFGGKAGLTDAVMDYCLDPSAWLDGGEAGLLARRAEELYRTTNPQMVEFLLEVGLIDEELLRAERRLFVQMAIWGMGADDPVVRSKLRGMYEFYDTVHGELADLVLDTIEAKGWALKKGMTIEELLVVCTAVAEGLAIRHEVYPESAPVGLTGRAFVALFESLIEPIGAGGELGDGFRAAGI